MLLPLAATLCASTPVHMEGCGCGASGDLGGAPGLALALAGLRRLRWRRDRRRVSS
jgi:uncharacterized protein (TIGR03382 family)